MGPEAVSPTNIAGGIHLDSTVANFDPLVVHEYLNGTGQAGGPLVTSFNVSSRSDLRLYESDNNATMIALGEQGEGFQNTCVNLLGRMIDTVPKGVVLSDIVTPINVKPINATLDFDNQGNLIFSGYIRVRHPSPPSSQDISLTKPPDPHPHLIFLVHRIPLPDHILLPTNPTDSRIRNRDIHLRNNNLLPLQHPHQRRRFIHPLHRLLTCRPPHLRRASKRIRCPFPHFKILND